eukprot:g9884.t1
MATRRPSGEEMAEAVEVQEPHPSSQASVRGSVQQPPGFVAVEGVPVAQATARPFAYVGIPLDDSDGASSSLLPPPPGEEKGAAGRVHGNVNLGVGNDVAGAEEAARASARRDNAAFVERKGVTQSQALSRVAEDLRAIEVARINAKRRDAEGLDMRPHPGNRLEPGKSESSLGAKGEKGWAYDAGSSAGKSDTAKEAAEAGASGGGSGGGGAGTGGEGGSEPEEASSPEGYQCAEYEPAEYVIPEYTSVYEKPSKK